VPLRVHDLASNLASDQRIVRGVELIGERCALRTERARRPGHVRAGDPSWHRARELPDDVDTRLFVNLVMAPFVYDRVVSLDRARQADIEPVVDLVIAAFSRVPT
jgi:hypothetical protein